MAEYNGQFSAQLGGETVSKFKEGVVRVIVNKLELQDASAQLKAQIHALNKISAVRLIHDIEAMEEVAELIGKGSLGHHFARNANDLSPGQLMVIAAYNEDGAPVGMVAARRDSVPGWDLRTFLAAHWLRLYPGERLGTFATFDENSSQYASGLKGAFAYIGDGWISKEYRGGNLLALIQRWLLLLVYDEWKPDLIYGWMRPDKVRSGYAARWGYSIVYPKGITWKIKPKQTDLHDLYFVAVDQHGIRQLILDETVECSG